MEPFSNIGFPWEFASFKIFDIISKRYDLKML